jgi:hypothetical protein
MRAADRRAHDGAHHLAVKEPQVAHRARHGRWCHCFMCARLAKRRTVRTVAFLDNELTISADIENVITISYKIAFNVGSCCLAMLCLASENLEFEFTAQSLKNIITAMRGI